MNFFKGLLLSLLLLASSNCYAVTEFISVINKAGSEDYNTLTLWEAAMDDAGNITDGTVKTGNWDAKTGSIPADGTAMDWDGGSSTGTLIHASENNTGSGGDQYLIDVTGGSLADNDVLLDVSTSTDGFTIAGAPDSVIITAECFDDDGDLANAFTIDGLTTDATNFLKVTSPAAERHDGTPNSGFKITSSTGGIINVKDQYSVLEWLIINQTVAGRETVKGNTDNDLDNSTFQNLVLINGGIKIDDDNIVNIWNNIIIGSGSGIGMKFFSADAVIKVYNNTVTGFDVGIEIDDILHIYSNNIAYDNVTDFEGSTRDAASTNNLTKDGTAIGVVSYPNKTLAFADTGSDDYHLAAGDSDAIDKGTDLGAGAWSFDIDNRDRDAEGDTWDIGAHEFVSVAAGVIKTINGVAWANIKTINGVAVGSIKTYNGKAAQ